MQFPALPAQDDGICEGCSSPVSVDGERPQPFRKIGQGSFGAIFAHPMVPVIYKREIRSDSGWGWSIEGEFAMHKLISAAFDKWSLEGEGNDTSLHVCPPSPHVLILADSTNWWAQCSSRFPPGEPDFCVPSPTLQAERIPSLPQAVRHDLIGNFCAADSVRAEMKTDPANDICLLRLYLGRRTRPRTSCQDSQIHDFPCHVDQMRTLDLDTHYIAAQIGRALAVLHFEARVDGRDVEFVLGSARQVAAETGASPTDGAREDGRLGTDLYKAATIWCLDFNQCQPISFSLDGGVLPTCISPAQTSPPTTIHNGTIKCIAAYFANDPYFPRPHQPELWATFSRSYEDMAGQIGAAAATPPSPSQHPSDPASQNQTERAAATAHGEGVLGSSERTKSLARALTRGVEEIFRKARIKRCAVED